MKYKTNPPTSGNHNKEPSVTGVLAVPVIDEQLVQNLENGHIVMYYQPGQIPAATVNQLVALVHKDPYRLLLESRDEMPYKVAFTAWRELQGCNAPTSHLIDAARDFVRKFVGKGPRGNIPQIERIFETPPVTSPSPTASASESLGTPSATPSVKSSSARPSG